MHTIGDKEYREMVPIQIHKPELIRLLLDKLDEKYDDYLEQKEEKRMKYVMMLYLNGVMEKIPVENRRAQ